MPSVKPSHLGCDCDNVLREGRGCSLTSGHPGKTASSFTATRRAPSSKATAQPPGGPPAPQPPTPPTSVPTQGCFCAWPRSPHDAHTRHLNTGKAAMPRAGADTTRGGREIALATLRGMTGGTVTNSNSQSGAARPVTSVSQSNNNVGREAKMTAHARFVASGGAQPAHSPGPGLRVPSWLLLSTPTRMSPKL